MYLYSSHNERIEAQLRENPQSIRQYADYEVAEHAGQREVAKFQQYYGTRDPATYCGLEFVVAYIPSSATFSPVFNLTKFYADNPIDKPSMTREYLEDLGFHSM